MLKEIEKYIERNPQIKGGRPVYKGTRILVSYIIDHFHKGWSKTEIKANFPEVDNTFLNTVSNIISREIIHEEIEKKEIKITWLSYA